MATPSAPDVNPQSPVAQLIAAHTSLKSGFRSCEFTALIAGMLGALWLALQQRLSPEFTTAALTLAPLLFGLLRNALKKAHNEKVQALLATLLDSAQGVILPPPPPSPPATASPVPSAAAVLALCAAFLFTGCSAAPLKARVVSLANAEDKTLLKIGNTAADAELQRLNAAVEQAAKDATK